MASLPEHTNIKIEYDGPFQKIIIPHKSGGILRVFAALFLIFWLGGWSMGWISAASALIKDGGKGNLFLFFWLGAWTVGGFFAFWFLYRLLRPPVPETLILARPKLIHDTGIAPFPISFSFKSQLDIWKNLFKKRMRIEFTQEEIKTLKLREHDDGNRLTIDKANKRIEIAVSVSEIEREWLFETLKSNYT